MIDLGIITGSGMDNLARTWESRVVESRFGAAEVAVFKAGRWTVGASLATGRATIIFPTRSLTGLTSWLLSS